jgi:hypothetical protein
MRDKRREIVGEAYCLDKPEALVTYFYITTPMHRALPDIVVMPKDTEEAAGLSDRIEVIHLVDLLVSYVTFQRDTAFRFPAFETRAR